jgi:hypothetical protein
MSQTRSILLRPCFRGCSFILSLVGSLIVSLITAGSPQAATVIYNNGLANSIGTTSYDDPHVTSVGCADGWSCATPGAPTDLLLSSGGLFDEIVDDRGYRDPPEPVNSNR